MDALRNAFDDVQEIDLVEGALESVRSQVGEVDTAFGSLWTSGREFLAPGVDAAWNALLAKADTDCG